MKDTGERRAKKSLGQNFLHEEKIIEGIFSLAQINEKDSVLEIGPGTGALTKTLAEKAGKLVAVELDATLAAELKDFFQENNKVTILSADILQIHLANELSLLGFQNRSYKVVANIPYYITAPIIRMLLTSALQPKEMILMVQNEVAERLAAKPGELSILGVMAQYYAEVEKKIFVPREAFSPVPKVDSAVIWLRPIRGFCPEDKAFFRVVRAGFAARRKTLVNNLAAGLGHSREEIEILLENLGLRRDIRAQALSVSEWLLLAEKLVPISTKELPGESHMLR